MEKKVLFVASVASHIKAFHLPYLEWFQEHGYETHVACSGDESLPYVNQQWHVDFVRSPYSFGHFKAFSQLKKVLDNEGFELITCHTPMASVLTRLAAIQARARGTKLIYVAHGFHFFKGASIVNWLFYYPIEILLSGFTDNIVSINSEDFERIKSKGSSRCNYSLLPGIGVKGDDFFKVSAEDKFELRRKKGVDKSIFLLVYAAEFIPRKNHKFIIEAVQENRSEFEGIKIFFAGKGLMQRQLEDMVDERELNHIIEFIGFRKDIDEIYKMADLGISSSKQEGLGLNLVEEMMCGLPVVATVDRGHKEIIEHGINGFLFEQNNYNQFVQFIMKTRNDSVAYERLSAEAIRTSSRFELRKSMSAMSDIYRRYLTIPQETFV
ncbi:glycosyltransferase [Marinilabilia sp.]|uniref:glycosyltransferase n=1 Tax=Marinilabilia sp. TaxID=2021252 RepID=UPI0025C45130|nr:glycosyltransferase [Marinilabilia sp.]